MKQILKRDLIFTDISQHNYRFTLPMLIDENNNVLLGNSCKEQFKDNDEIKCIICKSDEFIKDTLIYIENVVAEENNENRLASIDKELTDYLLNEMQVFEEMSLFNFKEYECITEDNFIKPAPYNFEKAKRNKQEEDEGEIDYDDMFSRLRGM